MKIKHLLDNKYEVLNEEETKSNYKGSFEGCKEYIKQNQGKWLPKKEVSEHFKTILKLNLFGYRFRIYKRYE